MIECINLIKTYKIRKRDAGLHNAIRSLFSYEYEIIKALQGISFSVTDGEIVGYIGPNGAGKSTTIKTMCGILTPDEGSCIVNGRIPWKERKEYVREIGVVFGQRSQLWWDVPVIDSFELLKNMYRVENRDYKRNLEELVCLLELKEILKTPTRNLSLGQRMRCEIAASLLHNPKVLFLDEPTIGLDAISKINVRNFIKKINEEHGTTVILTTHDMQDIEELTDRILLIGKGKILLDGNLESLKKHISTKKTIEIKFKGKQPQMIDGITLMKVKEGQLRVSVDPDILPVSEAIMYLSSQTEIIDLSVSSISAEEMAARLYKEYQL